MIFSYKLCLQGAPLILKRSQWSRVHKLNIYARLDVIRNIKRKLNTRKLEVFRNTSFGSFLNIKFSKLHSQLLYNIIKRQCTLKKINELWFNFKGTIAKFDIKEFEAIVGLNCGPLPTVDTFKVKERFLSKYFKNEDPIPRSRVSFLFNDSKNMKEEDKIKMTKIYFLENFLLGK